MTSKNGCACRVTGKRNQRGNEGGNAARRGGRRHTHAQTLKETSGDDQRTEIKMQSGLAALRLALSNIFCHLTHDDDLRAAEGGHLLLSRRHFTDPEAAPSSHP